MRSKDHLSYGIGITQCYLPHGRLAEVILPTLPWHSPVGYSFYRPAEGGRLSRPRQCSKGAQPVPMAVPLFQQACNAACEGQTDRRTELPDRSTQCASTACNGKEYEGKISMSKSDKVPLFLPVNGFKLFRIWNTLDSSLSESFRIAPEHQCTEFSDQWS